jgi:predicted ArsR family transcriptional regulator
MQQTRQNILEILKERGEATVDEIVTDLSDRIGEITAVTVRHHLDILRGDGLVDTPTVRRRSSPGRPQYVYALTDRAANFFPDNYQMLARTLMDNVKQRLPASEVNVILDNIADRIIDGAPHFFDDPSLEKRLDALVDYLENYGYTMRWERQDEDYALYVINCPYQKVVQNHAELCRVDSKVITTLLDAKVYPVQMNDGGACVYKISS